ncbi:MAG TPA: enolase C-terminal domain-like protein, partial [Solirubrobacteraceae bacterium]|nr:enolase C-terminal domain-like protein [Solirubrobacteraceae bacterium]
RAHNLPLSLHCGPAIHLHPATALEQLVHLEYFHDHVRIEQMLFDGVVEPVQGALVPDLERAGIGLELKRAEAERYAA